jgi:hypothetical protein
MARVAWKVKGRSTFAVVASHITIGIDVKSATASHGEALRKYRLVISYTARAVRGRQEKFRSLAAIVECSSPAP